MPRGQAHHFTVLHKRQITPHMVRISLGGEGMNTFPKDQEGAYVKLTLGTDERGKPRLRTYTVRAQTHDAIDIDFVIHHDGGPAIQWARESQPGDTIDIRGPGAVKRADPMADWFLFVGDMTALPAISANLENLPVNAKGHAVLEVIDEADRQTLDAPQGIDIQWVINPEPGRDSQALIDAVRSLPWHTGRPAVWCACEFSTMLQLRNYFRNDQEVDKKDIYISSYWQVDNTEEAHKVTKRTDAESQS